jgi:hypothetical protein
MTGGLVSVWLVLGCLLAVAPQAPVAPLNNAPSNADAPRVAQPGEAAPVAATSISPSARTASQKLMVLPPEVRLGVDARAAALVTDVLVTEVRRIPGYGSVVSTQDVQQALAAEQRRQLVGCSDPQCATDLARLVDVDEVLYGTLGLLGGTELVLTITHLDVRTNKVLHGMAERLSGASEDAMLDAVPRLLSRMFPAYTLPPARVRASLGPVPLVLSMTGLGAVVEYAALATVMLSYLLSGPIPGLNLAVGALALAAFLASPVAGAFVMAFLMDALGRRVVGARHAAVAGVIALLVYGPLAALGVVGLAVGLVAYIGLVLGLAGLGLLAEVAGASGRAGPLSGSLFFNASGTLGSGVPVAIGVLYLVAMGALVGLVVVPPLVQAIVALRKSEPRALDADISSPGLYSSVEDPPAALSFLPRFILGGRGEPAVGRASSSPNPADAGTSSGQAP